MNRYLSALILLLVAVAGALAQETTGTDDAAGAAGAIAGMGCTCLILLIAVGVQVAIAVWVYKDAKSRGMENALLLTILCVFTGVLGLIIYLLMRPKEKLPPGTGV
jgi:cytochrome bd-type quinol oxidase subunit 2